VKTRVKKQSVPVLEPVKMGQVVRLVAGSDGEQREVVEERPYLFISRTDDQGRPLREVVEELVEHVRKARRIRYSRHFFPMAVKDLRRMAFSGELIEGDDAQVSDELLAGSGQEDVATGVSVESGLSGVVGSSWVLNEAEEYSPEVEVYEWRRKRALLDALDEVRSGRRLSRRVVGIWAYQQGEQRSYGYWERKGASDGKDKEDASG
jgi:hypothetical protein